VGARSRSALGLGDLALGAGGLITERHRTVCAPDRGFDALALQRHLAALDLAERLRIAR
jgi:hypothetical protein